MHRRSICDQLCSFYNSLAADGMQQQIVARVSDLVQNGGVDRSSVSLYTCGHSLGGALACLCAGVDAAVLTDISDCALQPVLRKYCSE